MAEQVGDNVPPLSALAERIMNLLDEKDSYTQDIKDVYAEAKAHGYDTKILRKVISRLRRDRKEVEEEDEMIDTYENALVKKFAKAGVKV